ncbi:MAG TPA: DNA mismatch repair protein MutS [Thermoanaerobaculia bacterium]|nr:DNA mismatch repair protein MutS [Thermoanaerobaculia bacterium]
MSVASRVTPMLQQYFEAKALAGDALLLYRMGDFYELFFDDAKRASALLGLTLTSRHRDSDIEAPMCGMPHHAVEGYIAQLVAAGHRVAVCDQVEDAKKAKGLVRREITRIVTPGTVLEPESLPSSLPNYLAALCRRGRRAGVAFLDLSTGELRAGEVGEEELSDVMSAYPAREILLPEGETSGGFPGRATSRPAAAFVQAAAEKRIAELFRAASLEAFGFAPGDAGLAACWAALEYARENRRGDALHISPPRPLAPDRHLRLDASTLAHLEIFESADARPGATLFSVLDECVTPMGSRALRETLARPLRSNPEIEARLDAVEELVSRAELRGDLRERLRGAGDLARRVGRVALKAAGPRDVAGLGATLDRMPDLLEALRPLSSPLLSSLRDRFPETADLARKIATTLADEPPAVVSAGGAIRDGADAELAELRALRGNAQQALTRFEARERDRTGIANLRVRFNRVFGYSIEITRGQKEKTPSDYVRRQTLANAERYTTPELSELESKILGADERLLEIEARVFGELAAFLASEAMRLAELARVLGQIDLFAALAETAAARGYARPRIADRPGIRIVEGRHPVVERVRRDEPFVPNDVGLDADTRIVILTGPNMGGKSTYLRQTALIALLARAGAFVPAREAEIGPIDRIFTRVGASDHLARGESTFMVEMIEAANILRNATPESLVILDEVGRGTSTFDGLSLAWAIVEHLRDAPERRAFTLFATHYHEMTELAKTSEGVANFTMAVREWEGKVVFLRKVVPGGADRSYGIHVAELAGLPEAVIARAREVLANLEEQELDVRGLPKFARKEGEAPKDGQFLLFAGQEELVLEKLREVEIDQLTPVAALSLLASLQDRVRR